MRVLGYLETRSRATLWLLSSLLMVLVGTLDAGTGSEISFSIFYVLPVSLASWTIGRRGGVVISILSTLVWLSAEQFGGRVYSTTLILFWNALVRGSFFLIVTFALAALRRIRAYQEEMQHFIVHDLRSPVANVQTALTLLGEIRHMDMGEDERTLINSGLMSSRRSLTLINSLLDLAKLESGKLTLQQQMVRTAEFVDPAIQQVTAMAGRGDVTIKNVIDSSLAAFADPKITVRILVNLLSNAIKHSPMESTITVSAEAHDRSMLAIRVSDQGAGIPAEWQNKVFDRFSQVEVRNAGYATGSGLGLTFCRLAVESQGGRIWLESEVGHGTTVIFTLPQRDTITKATD